MGDGRMFATLGGKEVEVPRRFARPGESPTATIDRFVRQRGYQYGGPYRITGEPVVGRAGGVAAGAAHQGFQNLGTDNFRPKGVKFDKPAEFYGNLGAIRGISFDSKTKQLALLGDGNPTLPALRLDDFVTAIRVVYGHHPGEPNNPTFSLDPADPDNPAGDWLQPVYRPGLLEGTHMGDVMLRADWVLKQYAFGVFADYDGIIRGKRVSAVAGFRSYLELLRLAPELLSEGGVCSRFWILPLEMKLEQQGNTLVFTRATMQVKTQRMENVGGRLEDNPDSSDPAANGFAAFFTANYDRFAREAPVLEEVRQTAKVVAIVKWLKKVGVGVNDLDIDWKQEAAQQPDAELASSELIRSLSITESVALWGLHSSVVRIVGGVELAPRPVAVPAATKSSLDRDIHAAMTGPTATAVGQVVSRIGEESRRYVAAAVPITPAGRELLQQHPVYEYEGLIYALDGTKNIRTVMDGRGNSATLDYDNQERLTAVHYRDADDWQLDGTLTDDGGREFSIRSPKGDRQQYRFGADGVLSETLVNGRTVVRRVASADPASIKFEHIETVEEWPIGGIGGPKKTEKVVATEQVIHRDDEIRYERHRPGRDAGHVTCTLSGDSLTVDGSCIAKTHLQQTDNKTIVETGPQGRITYQFDPDSRELRKIAHENGDFVELSVDKSGANGSPTVLRAKKGTATAQVRMTKGSVTVQDFAGNEFAYAYREGLLRSLESPAGTTTYEYTKDEKRLAAIHYPDKTVQHYDWQIGPGMRRLTTWWEKTSK